MSSTAWKLAKVDLSEYINQPNPGYRAYMQSQADGEMVDIRTPLFGKDTPFEDILNPWIGTLKAELSGLETPEYVERLLEFEMDNAAKAGPLSARQPYAKRQDKVYEYFTDIWLKSVPIQEDVIDNLVIPHFTSKLGALRMQSVKGAMSEMVKGTNSGSPFFIKRREALGKSVPFVLSNGEQTLKGRTYKIAAILGWRGQEGGPLLEDVKQRTLFLFPMCVNIEEARIYNPLIRACQAANLVPAWVGDVSVNQFMTNLFNNKPKDQLVIATDFKGFDQHFNIDMQNSAQRVLAALFKAQDWFDNVYRIKYEIPMLLPGNKLIYGPHGMGSGSGGTNADETLAHTCLQFESYYNRSVGRDNFYHTCLGDDGVISYPGITVEGVTEDYTQHGQVMEKTKQYVSTHTTTYLRKLYSDLYRIDGQVVGVYSTCRALGRICHMERWYDNWDATKVVLRTLSILENVRYHPLRNQFASYVMRGDRYRLGIDIPGFLDNIEDIAKEANDSMRDFMSYSATYDGRGISSWWIVQWLKSKS